MCFCEQKSIFLLAPKKKKMGQNEHVKHDLGVDLSLLRQTADIRVSSEVGYVYFTHAVIDVAYYATHGIFNTN